MHSYSSRQSCGSLRLTNDPPGNAEDFTKIVFRIEGLDPNDNLALYNQVHSVAAAAFVRAAGEGGL